jgi:macrodomain Ter protein organizer (MatP/YcbG family)
LQASNETRRATNAAYQRAFRPRHKDSGEKRRLDLIVPTPTWMKLQRLARHKSYTVIETIAELAAKAEGRALDRMSDAGRRRYLGPLED